MRSGFSLFTRQLSNEQANLRIIEKFQKTEL